MMRWTRESGPMEQDSRTFVAADGGVVASVTAGPTPMSRLLIWVIVIVATIGTIFISIFVVVFAVAASSSLNVGKDVPVGAVATFIPAEGWQVSQAEAGLPTGTVAYSKGGVSMYLWAVGGNGNTGMTAAKATAQEQFPGEFDTGNYFNITQFTNTQLRMGIEDKPALAFGYANFDGSNVVSGFSKGTPTDADDFTALFGDISNMWGSVAFRNAP
jgi:hypothetical protein